MKVETDAGVTGLATLHGSHGKQACELFQAIQPLVVGMDAMAHEAVWQKVFALSNTPPRPEQGIVPREAVGNDRRALLMRCIAGIDIALWDIKGKALNMPVWRLLGGERTRVPAYVTGGYYRWGHDSMTFGGELATYISEGFDTVKMKLGGLSLDEDVKRVAEARREIGPDAKLAIDANNAYSVPEAIEAIKRYEEYGIAWFEEPVHWYDACRGMGQLAAATHVPLASGESEIHSWACRDLVDLGKLRIMQYDATRFGGVTDWLRVAQYCNQHGVLMYTHHQPHIQCHLTAAMPNGGLAETFSKSARDPFWEELYTERADLRDGHIVLTDKPGFGFDIDWKVVEKYRV